MATLTELLVPPMARGHLRPIDARRDLKAIADLVELCFHDTLDEDGRGYLRQMREAARSYALLNWAVSVAEQTSTLPVSGYIWEEEGHIVGNLSLIPLTAQGWRCFLIANVAVHPEYRDRGIGRTLTSTAVEYCRRKGIHAAWLQVREENQPAVHIYQSLGFIERARRTTWNSTRELTNGLLPAGVSLGPRQAHHWPLQRAWLDRLYPTSLRWHLPLNLRAMEPSLWGGLYRFFSLEYPQHWVAERDGRLLGVLSRLEHYSRSDPLWLAAPPEPEVDIEALQGLLSHVHRRYPQRSLSLNCPARYAERAFQAAGFAPQQTLMWMELPLRTELSSR